MNFKKCTILFCLYFSSLFSEKIIGLMQIKNEENIIEYSLRALAKNTDAIIVLDDNSEDHTLEILNQLKEELNIIEIITNTRCSWVYESEVTSRQKLLDAGRKHGGTHFIEIDADEVISTHCSENDWLRNTILSLKKGQILQIPIINLWKDFDHYRSKFTDNFPDICYCTMAYCDDGISDLSYNKQNSHPGFLHFGRFPHKKPDAGYDLFVYEPDINHSLIHLPFVNWDNVIVKKVWIMMLEIIRLQEKLYNQEKYPEGRTIQDISKFYQSFHNYDDENVQLSPTPSSWLNYPFFKKEPYIKNFSNSKLADIQKWIRQYGKDFFAGCPYIEKHLPSLLQPNTACIMGWAPEITTALAKELENHNIQATVSSECDYMRADIVITINVDPNIANRVDKYNQESDKKIKLYSIVLEPAHVDWQPYNLLFYQKYDVIFTLDDSFINHPYLHKYTKINFPQKDLSLRDNQIPFSQRKLLTIVNGYKYGSRYSPTFAYDLYQERLNLIDYFNANEPSFDFYGQGWENGPYKEYRSYKGSIPNKIETLKNYKFVICFENSCITLGYITEKIFDALIAGTVPIYWGAPNIDQYIPKDCFIDMKKYGTYESLHNYLISMPEEEYKKYLDAIASFLRSPESHSFLNTEVSHVITQKIIDTLN